MVTARQRDKKAEPNHPAWPRTVAIISGGFSVIAVVTSVYTFLITRNDTMLEKLCHEAIASSKDVDAKHKEFSANRNIPERQFALSSALWTARFSLTKPQANVVLECLPDLGIPGNTEKFPDRLNAATVRILPMLQAVIDHSCLVKGEQNLISKFGFLGNLSIPDPVKTKDACNS